jgi:RNA polymerase sigma-70 factor (ECF subfamily)
VLRFTIRHGKIAEIDLISDPARISRLDLAVLGIDPLSAAEQV